MKKLSFAVFFVFACTVSVFSQAQRQESLTTDDVYKALDQNFENYAWVHLLLADKSEDKRAPRVKMNRLSYDINVIDENGMEKTGKGEVVYVEIIKGGYRYDIKLDFSPKKEKGAERSATVKGRIYGKLLVDVARSEQ
ncbi:MAG: hypothetical protein LBC77_06250 [Spirochaetaceae bacterium]|jgi:hypothetical protein|nr:hypothetical protein [Spirochaetaceae bacterium]